MAFLETPRFPACPSFGFTASPQYSTTIVRTAGGFERRNRNWERALTLYTVTVSPRGRDEITEILEFWHAVGGPECGFRFRDYSDYLSCRVGGTVAATDQPISTLGVDYILTKQYTAGARTQIRRIWKPIEGTILLADNGAPLDEGVDYTINYATGVVELVSGFEPVGNLTWGGEFDVPVRFDSEFPVEIIEKAIHGVQFQLTELRDPTA